MPAMQYKYPHVSGDAAHFDCNDPSLPIVVMQLVPSSELYMSKTRFIGYVGALPALVVDTEPLSPSVGSMAMQVRPGGQFTPVCMKPR